MSRVRRGTQDLKGGKVLVKSASRKGARKIRCMGCKRLVSGSQAGNGKPVYKCVCGRVSQLVAM